MPDPMRHDWYDLFSRGARDWLRHNDKVREAVREHLPEALSAPDLMTAPGQRGVRVPLKLLEHARFRLSDEHSTTGAGQGPGQPGDILRSPYFDDDDNGAGGEGGAVTLLMEFSVDEIMDWLWEELQLPQLEPRGAAAIDQSDVVRSGWDKRGAASRLDRRRTVKEAVKRRVTQEKTQDKPVPFTNEDLRFKQLVHRRKPATNAVVIFALDVSASMTDAERKLAKSFFFFVLQGIRRRYGKVETRFIAHTTQAWEFSEHEFFNVSGTGGTGASTAFKLALELIETEYDPSQYNGYLFYASDGENFTADQPQAQVALEEVSADCNYCVFQEAAVVAVAGHVFQRRLRLRLI